ncbi:MAG: hypothetical protein HRU19_18340 [Pseudobacteriovorax sp.]|nr:hypothetical protein [Pseudobacteriovorax sp.]
MKFILPMILGFFATVASANTYTYWHQDNEVRSTVSDGFTAYDRLGNRFAKIVTDGDRVLEKFYDFNAEKAFQMVLGRALFNGDLRGCFGREFDRSIVLFHRGTECVLAASTQDRRWAEQAYDQISPAFAKILMRDGRLQEVYGEGNPVYQCIGDYIMTETRNCF